MRQFIEEGTAQNPTVFWKDDDVDGHPELQVGQLCKLPIEACPASAPEMVVNQHDTSHQIPDWTAPLKTTKTATDRANSENAHPESESTTAAPGRTMKRLGLVMVLTLTSQVLAACTALVLPILGLSTADTYAIGTQVALTGLNGVAIGVVYNVAVGRPQFRAWRRWSTIATSVTLILTAGQIGLLSHTGFMDGHNSRETVGILALLGCGGAVTAATAVNAVRRACLGKPALFAAIAIAPNLGLLLGTGLHLAFWRSGGPPFVSMLPAFGWASAAVGLYAFARTLKVPEISLAPSPAHTDSMSRHIIGLAIGVITSSILPMLYMAAVAQLESGTVFLTSTIGKIGNSATMLFVNSVLLVQYNWVDSRAPLRVLPIALTVAFTTLVPAGIGLHLADSNEYISRVIVIVGWLLMLAVSAITVRELNAQRKGGALLAKATVDLVLASSAAYLLLRNPTFIGYFGAFAVSQAVTTTIGGFALRQRLLGYAGIGSLGAAFALLLLGW